MASQRQIKYGNQLKKDLSEIFQKDTRYFFKYSLVTITHILVTQI